MENLTAQVLATELTTAILIVVGGFILSLLVSRILKWLLNRYAPRTETMLDDVIFKPIIFPLRAAIIVFAFELALDEISFIPESWSEPISRIAFAAYAVLAFLFLFRLINGLAKWYGREVAQRTDTDLDDKFLELIRRVTLLALTMVIIIMILNRFGVEVNGLIASLGIASLAVALAAQDTLGNMFAGLSIMIDQPFNVGDRVEVLDIAAWGDVQEIGLRSTRILTLDNRTVTIPNAVIGQGLIVNYTEPERRYRVETRVGVAYGVDVDEARQVMIEAIGKQDWVMKDELIEALFMEFGESALIFRVRCWIDNYVEARRAVDKLNSTLYRALQEAGLGIPVPQRELRLVSPVKVERMNGNGLETG